MKNFLIRTLLFLLLFGAVTEVCFRWVIPARETPNIRQEPSSMLLQYDPKSVRQGLFTSGRVAQQRSQWSINAQGWNNPIDFRPDTERKQPVVVITGDSQIEGFYVDPDAHIVRRLAQRTQNTIEGYSIAASGYKLGEYIAVAHYLAQTKINPEFLILFINRGDFWRGVTNLAGRTGVVPRIRILPDGSGELTKPGPLPINRWRRLFKYSATIRYLFFNANINPLATGPADLAMNTVAEDPEADASQRRVYAQAFTFTIRSIQAALPKTKILVLVDGDRRAIMADQPPKPIPTSAVIAAGCPELGCVHLDLTEPFTNDWKANRRPLHFDHNIHWNTHAHDVAAEVVFAELIRRRWLPILP